MPKKLKKSGVRKPNKRLYILCEGAKDKSEFAYLNAFIRNCSFKGSRVSVEVVDSIKNTGRELVKAASELKEMPDDTIWVVYDKDDYPRHPDTFHSARVHNVKIAFSSISFEYWILLHYKYTAKAFDSCDDLLKYMKSKIDFDYSKSSASVFDDTKHLLGVAKQNAKKIQKYQASGNPKGTPIYKFNPYTNINELIEEIESLQS